MCINIQTIETIIKRYNKQWKKGKTKVENGLRFREIVFQCQNK
jgi:hypothetical protein